MHCQVILSKVEILILNVAVELMEAQSAHRGLMVSKEQTMREDAGPPSPCLMKGMRAPEH